MARRPKSRMPRLVQNNSRNLPLYLLALILVLHLILYGFVGSCVLFNVNTGITLTLWILAIYLAYHYQNNLWLIMPLGLFVLNEFLYSQFNLDGLVGAARTKLFYDITTTYFIQQGNNTNLTEGMYLKDIRNDQSLMTVEEAKQLDPGEANRRKFEKFFLFLEIDPSEYSTIRILDLGCGNGDFIQYCKSIGVDATGMSISKEQVESMKKKGLDVYLGSYRELQPQFVGKYDMVTFWGSLEHMTQSYPCSKSGERKAEKEIQRIMGHVKQYFKPQSNYKKVFNTTLHMNRKVCQNTMNAYILERAYGGWYFYDEPKETLSDKIEPIGLQKMKQLDCTYHYYLATKLDEAHFGRPAHPNLYNMPALLFGLLVNPSFVFMSLYTLRGEWMWQFDNKLHFDESCDTCTMTERSQRPTTLLWSVNKMVQ